MLSPHARRNIARIWPFGLIWLITGWVFLYTEMAASGFQNVNPDSAITISWSIFVYASIAVFFVGVLMGYLEMVWIQKHFRRYGLIKKIFLKLLLYAGFVLVMLGITFPIAASLESSLPLTDPQIWEKTRSFFISQTFISTCVQIDFSILLSLCYSAFSEHLGHHMLFNLVLGRYQRPVEEERIFMFLDMKGSTQIAEQLGHTRYFDLLRAYYALMSEPLIAHEARVYQYIGDEVVITWPVKDGVRHIRVLDCFYAIQDAIKAKERKFMEEYGLMPRFKAGLHLGMVSTGEVGALKKEIVFTGDVLNTAARIQGRCSSLNEELLISEDLRNAIGEQEEYLIQKRERIQLRGKKREIDIYAVTRQEENQRRV